MDLKIFKFWNRKKGNGGQQASPEPVSPGQQSQPQPSPSAKNLYTEYNTEEQGWLSWMYDKVKSMYKYAEDSFFDIAPEDAYERKLWQERQDEKKRFKDLESRLTARKNAVYDQYTKDLNKVFQRKKVCDNWYAETKTDLTNKRKDDENLYVSFENKDHPEREPKWETTPVNIDSYHEGLCERLCSSGEEQTAIPAEKQSSTSLTLFATSVSTSSSESDTRSRFPSTSTNFPSTDSRQMPFDAEMLLRAQHRELAICESDKAHLESLYKKLENKIYELQKKLIEKSGQNPAPTLTPTGSSSPKRDVLMPSGLKQATEKYNPGHPGVFSFSSPKGLWEGFKYVFGLPFLVGSGELRVTGIAYFFHVLGALLMLVVYGYILWNLYQAMKYAARLADDIIYTYRKNRQQQREDERENRLRIEKAQRRSYWFKIWGQRAKSVAHEGAEVANKWLKPVQALRGYDSDSNSKNSIRNIGRGGYIPPFPDASLFRPETYVGLTETEKEQMLFAYDPIHVVIRIAALQQEAEELLLEMDEIELAFQKANKKKSKQGRIKTAYRGTVSFIKSKRPSIAQIRAQVSAGLGYTSLVIAAYFGFSPYVAPSLPEMGSNSSIEIVSSSQRDRMIEELLSPSTKVKNDMRNEAIVRENYDAAVKIVSASKKDTIVEKLISNSPKLKKSAFSGNAIRENAAIEQLINHVEESEELVEVASQKSASNKRSSKSKRFNRKVHAFSDLQGNRENNIAEIVEETISQPVNAPQIKVR